MLPQAEGGWLAADNVCWSTQFITSGFECDPLIYGKAGCVNVSCSDVKRLKVVMLSN